MYAVVICCVFVAALSMVVASLSHAKAEMVELRSRCMQQELCHLESEIAQLHANAKSLESSVQNAVPNHEPCYEPELES